MHGEGEKGEYVGKEEALQASSQKKTIQSNREPNEEPTKPTAEANRPSVSSKEIVSQLGPIRRLTGLSDRQSQRHSLRSYQASVLCSARGPHGRCSRTWKRGVAVTSASLPTPIPRCLRLDCPAGCQGRSRPYLSSPSSTRGSPCLLRWHASPGGVPTSGGGSH